MGKLHLERGNIDQAASIFMDALTEDFNDADALYCLGSCFLQKEQYGAAANLIARAAETLPQAELLVDLGGCYKLTNRQEQAEEIWNLALGKAKSDRMRANIKGNIASLYVNNGTPDKAVELFGEASALDPDALHHKFNRGLAELERGNWAEGFRLYDLGFDAGTRTFRTYGNIKPYRPGADVRGKTIIVWGEQGIGDEIMFASCIPDLMRDAKRVIFDCHPRLVRLFEESFGIECHGTRKTQLAEWYIDSGADLSMSITQIATLYRSNGEFPGAPYLKAKRTYSTKHRVGISWAGGTVKTRSDLRSIPLVEWAGLLRSPVWNGEAEFHSLQYTSTAAREVAEFEEKTGIHVKHFPGKVECEDYATTAEFVAGLDLVVTVCTSIVHLAGALGVPCLCLTPAKPAWRYGVKGDMPWYRSVRLIRQSEGEDWADVLKRTEAEIENL